MTVIEPGAAPTDAIQICAYSWFDWAAATGLLHPRWDARLSVIVNALRVAKPQCPTKTTSRLPAGGEKLFETMEVLPACPKMAGVLASMASAIRAHP